MRRTNNQLRLVANSLAASTKLTDTSGNPSESYDWRHMATLRREWQHEEHESEQCERVAVDGDRKLHRQASRFLLTFRAVGIVTTT